tara:strand:+ start:727 stop:951 length:225 start_codon:yes stop_codon:yes gene_type:complete
MTETLLRYTVDISNVDKINIEIGAYQRLIDFYEMWIEKHGHYEYVSERLSYLNNQLAEYLIAREFSREGCRTYG